MPGDRIDFVVGRERRLQDVLTGNEVIPLLRRVVEGGMTGVALEDDGGEVLWSAGEPPVKGSPSFPLLLEGEPVGELRVCADGVTPSAVGRIVAGALQGMVEANLRRMLTTEIHTQVVNLSYEELLEANRLLTLSEGRYRELAATLEIKVRERTEELKRLYAHLIQQEKMASVGQLAAGMAHEINNPLGFVLSNLRTLERYCARLVEMLDFYRTASGHSMAEGEKLHDRLKIAFIREDLEGLLSQSISGAERIKKIVADLKGFSHIDDIGAGFLDLGEEIDRILGVMSGEIPEGTRIVREYAPLSPLRCEGGNVAQALFSILRNAFQSRPEGLEVLVRTEPCGEGVRITVADNGPGIAEEIRSRIFEPFFTTRPVGEGVGLGLTIAYNAVKRCGGTVRAEERSEGGTAFIIHLPPAEGNDAALR